MKLHANAALSLNKRRVLAERIVEEGWSLTKAAEAAEVSEPTAGKWARRYRAEGELGLHDRSSAPRDVHNRTCERRVQLICSLRRLRMTAAEIAEVLGMPETTISGILTRSALGRLGRLGMEPARRYERQRPGELLHIDVKKLGRITRGAGKRITGGHSHYTGSYTDKAGRIRRKAGWEFCHVCVDDATRLAYVEVLQDERAITAVGFLKRALAFYRRHGVSVEAVMTDNGSAYISTVHAVACRALGIRHCAPVLAARRPTARPNASSARCWAAGPTAPSTEAPASGPLHSRAGYGATTSDDRTALSAEDRPQLDSLS